MSLAKFLANLTSGFLRGEKISPDQSDKTLTELVRSVYDGSEMDTQLDFQEIGDPLGAWLTWGDHLRINYSIEQYAFVQWEQD